jgi:hypothetical protein
MNAIPNHTRIYAPDPAPELPPPMPFIGRHNT